ncbi:hypothetical protein J3R82DRAFT_11422 [Butyriboletus roseoflavus]|nr:hypothetical protein J3R82DRAFT_11422 [Butyriboletus roseoflavus]
MWVHVYCGRDAFHRTDSDTLGTNDPRCRIRSTAILERAAAGGVANPRVAAWPLDLSSFENVRAFADRFAAEANGNGALHALVANAGVFRPDYAQTPDGWEVMYVFPARMISSWSSALGCK